MTKPWDEYREIIIAEYKDQNKPLHVVQRTMEEKYGFKASTRAYRSRFDKWGIHKYTHRQHGHLDAGEDGEDLIADATAGLSLHARPDDSGHDIGSPVVGPPHLYNPNQPRPSMTAYGTTHVFKTESQLQYQYIPSMISMAQSTPRYASHQFGSAYDTYYPQETSYYPSNPMPYYQDRPDGMMGSANPLSPNQTVSCKQEPQWDTTPSRSHH